MTTPLFLRWCAQLGLSIRDLNLLIIGTMNDMYTEIGNNSFDYSEVTVKEGFDQFKIVLLACDSCKSAITFRSIMFPLIICDILFCTVIFSVI